MQTPIYLTRLILNFLHKISNDVDFLRQLNST